MQKRGIAVPTALVLISVLFIFFTAMMNFSSHEMSNVKLAYEKKRAEYLAYSGLNWAEVKLQAKRWWVNDGFDPSKKVPRPTGAAVTHEFFGDGNGKTYIIVEEFASAKPSPVKGYSKIQKLDHIRVFSIGEYKEQRVLVYGKYIMSPEPFLNSDSTEGAETQTTASTEEGKVVINIPEPWTQDGDLPELLIVKSINVAVGAKVDPNVILAVIANHPDDPVQITMTWDIKAPAFGTLTKLNCSVGQSVRANDIFGECTDELMVATRSNKTLKKMVRVTKISDKAITDLDLTDFKVRREKLDALVKTMSDQYVTNYAKNLPYTEALKTSFGNPPMGEVVKKEEILKRLSNVPGASSLTIFTAGNKFMENMLEKWTMPGLTAPQREQFPGMSEYHLAIGKSKPRTEIMEVLSHFGRLDEIVTRPQKNPGLYKLTSTASFKNIMGISDTSKPSDEFVHDATFLQDAAKKITVKFDQGTPWEDATYKDMVANGQINAGDYWYWPSKKGWYTKPVITIEPAEIPYNFVNKASGKTFTMEVGFVLNYLRKHYDEGMAVPPGGTIRLPSDQQDTPQAPGPPDSTGAKYSGISS